MQRSKHAFVPSLVAATLALALAACGASSPSSDPTEATTSADPIASAQTGAEKVLVFTYGTLKPGHKNYGVMPDHTRCWADQIKANLHKISPDPDYPAAVRVGDQLAASVPGFVFEIDAIEVGDLDNFEGVPSLYTRVNTTTAGGHPVSVYQYARTNIGLKIPSWKPGNDAPALAGCTAPPQP